MSLTDAAPDAPGTGQTWTRPRTLEDRLADVVGLLNVCAAEMVDLIADAVRTGAWEGPGIRSPEHWVTWKCGVSPSRAHRLVALARGLEHLPATGRAFRAGELTEDQTAVVVRHTDSAHDTVVADLATSLTVPQLHRVLPSVPRTTTDDPASDGDGSGAAPGPHPGRDLGTRRHVAMGYGDDGGFWCSIRLPGDEGALIERALTQARTTEFRLRHPDTDHDDPALIETRGISWADALVRLADTALSGLDPDTIAGRHPAERNQTIIHVDADRQVPPRLHLGPVLPQGIADHLSCDTTVRYLLLRDGIPIAKGRRQRTVASGLRIIVEERDQGCRVPGCGQRRWLHIHHLIHWADGGPTDPSNLLALCPTHHRMVHKGLLHITGDPTRHHGLRVHDDHGRELRPTRPHPPPHGTTPHDAATTYGLPDPGWNPPPGEPLDTRWITWG